MASSSVKCELRVVGAKHVATKRKGAIFIRCYITAGNNRRVQLNTREIVSSKKVEDEYFFWDDVFALQCDGAEDSIRNLKEETVVFEMRLRNTKPSFLGKTGGSQVIARAEAPWKSVFEAKNMEILSWVTMVRDDGECSVKPPALQVGIKVEVVAEKSTTTTAMSKEEMRRKRRGERLRNWDDCGCGSNCADNELLLLAAALDVF